MRVAEKAPKADLLSIRGARTHNLKGIDLDLPREALTVVTGPSGSGKSSLVFDTLLAEGQRQYLESLSIYARQFLDQLQRPDVDTITGLEPTVAVDQSMGSHHPRSTVGTLTEVHDYLRLLYARAGQARCHACGTPIRQQSPDEIVAVVLALPERTKVMLLAPLVRGRRGGHQAVLDSIRKAGLVRVRIDGATYDVEQAPELEPRKAHHLEAVVDRIVIREDIQTRVAESVRAAAAFGEGRVLVVHATSDGWQERLYSTRYACPDCGASVEEIEPRTFSFNSPYGACPVCEGLGAQEMFDPELVVPDLQRSLHKGAIAPWREQPPAQQTKQLRRLESFLERHQLDAKLPLAAWPANVRQELLAGDDHGFAGVLAHLEMDLAATKGKANRQHLQSYRGLVTCQTCQGARLRPEARAVKIADLAIHELSALPIQQAVTFFEELSFPEVQQAIATPMVREIHRRLLFLKRVGLGYLTLDRRATSLSGGETQRVRLAACIGAGLVGVLYLLDEPSVGLHPRDNARLLAALRDLQQLGNTVIIVEHDEAFMRAADHLVDLGPGAGEQGGYVVAAGRPAETAVWEGSATGDYLCGRKSIPRPQQPRPPDPKRMLRLSGATANNLQDVEVAVPLGRLVGITGVSGSGKSSLIVDTLTAAVAQKLHGVALKPGPYRKLEGLLYLDRIVQIDQSPIGRTPRSNAATYTGVWNDIRKAFAQTKTAKRLGFGPGRFSFNTKGGRCETCQGHGQKRIEMQFLPDLYIPCPACHGKRFNAQTLTARYKQKTIADVLELPVDDAVDFFQNHAAVHAMLCCLQDVGLGYLALGQPSTTLSGGEAQRVKLAAELGKRTVGRTLYVLDEPTTGLHFVDVRRLLDVLVRLVEGGNTVLVIEHHLDMLKAADWIIDLGPEGGADGGRIVVSGTPEEVAQCGESHTGQFLRQVLTT